MHSASSSGCQNAVHVVRRLSANPAPVRRQRTVLCLPRWACLASTPARHCTFQAVGLTRGFNSLIRAV